MEYDLAAEGDTNKVTLRGRFTFTDNKAFREVVSSIREGGYRNCLIDMNGLEFIDSAGLGMLLLVRDAANESNVTLVVRGPRGQVKKMLDIARFDEILTIEV